MIRRWLGRAIATLGIVGGLGVASPVLAQGLPNAFDPQQAAIRMLEENPELVVDMVRTMLRANPGLVEQMQQNPERLQQTLEQNSVLVDYLQQNPELLEQLQQVLQETTP